MAFSSQPAPDDPAPSSEGRVPGWLGCDPSSERRLSLSLATARCAQAAGGANALHRRPWSHPLIRQRLGRARARSPSFPGRDARWRWLAASRRMPLTATDSINLRRAPTADDTRGPGRDRLRGARPRNAGAVMGKRGSPRLHRACRLAGSHMAISVVSGPGAAQLPEFLHVLRRHTGSTQAGCGFFQEALVAAWRL